MTAHPPRRWSFRLRTMLLGVTLVGALCGWVGYSLNWIRERHDLIREHKVWTPNPDPVPCVTPGGLWILGEKGSPSLGVKTADDVSEGRRLFPEATIHY